MPRVLVLADLHWAHWRAAGRDPFAGLGPQFWQTLDLVILAGDLANKAHIRWPQALADMGRFIDPARIHVVPGNHDYYDGKLDREDKLAMAAHSVGAQVAQCARIDLAGRRFLGCTLWTDMALGGDLRGNCARAERVMNDYRKIRMNSDGFRRAWPADTIALHKAHLSWLEAELARPFAGETVVITHHAPIAPEPAGDMDAAYGSDLREVIERHAPAMWLFGHTHRAQQAQVGGCALRNVSLGYPDEWPSTSPQLSQESPGAQIARGVLEW
ncbi:metallophosphoesterase [Albirhodobacter sp. R86504]|uniref:metallophosphoesterase n=1 Tax=Albirhodobacter sp. R86504 TaxID=3093848 RepID=UPI003671B9C8